MIGLDTNVLARYYIADRTDTEALRQRIAAQRLIERLRQYGVIRRPPVCTPRKKAGIVATRGRAEVKLASSLRY